MAAFQGPSDTQGNVKVQLQARLPRKMTIPARFLIPISPFKKLVGEKAVVVFGDEVGSEVEVKEADGDDWAVLLLASTTHTFYPRRYLAALPIIR
jgi:hypothetical protein